MADDSAGRFFNLQISLANGLWAIGALPGKNANGCICLSPGILPVRKEVSGLCERRFRDVSGAAGQGKGGEQLLVSLAGHGISSKGFLFC